MKAGAAKPPFFAKKQLPGDNTKTRALSELNLFYPPPGGCIVSLLFLLKAGQQHA